MTIGIDISQTAYQNTGVSNYLTQLITHLTSIDKKNKYVLFYSSFRKKVPNLSNIQSAPNVELKHFRFPPSLLSLLWNKLHILPIERLIGDIDIFISSDWTEPPTLKAKKATILYDLIVYKYPQETDKKITNTQKQKLKWTKKECDIIFAISESTKKDAQEILEINENKIKVIYPGI